MCILIRQCNAILLLLLWSAGSACAQWNGFPLAASTNYYSFQQIRAAGIDPIQQICGAIVERWDVWQWHYGETNDPPDLVYTLLADIEHEEVLGHPAGWYWTDGWFYGYTEPDAVGSYYVHPVWVTPLEIEDGWPGEWYVRIDDTYVTNTWTTTEPVIVNNAMREVAAAGWTGVVSRSVIDTLWGTIASMAAVYMDMHPHGSGTNYYASPSFTYTPPLSPFAPTNAYYRALVDVPLTLGRLYPDTDESFGFTWWEYKPRVVPRWLPYLHYQRVLTKPEKASMLAEAHYATNGWITVAETSAYQYDLMYNPVYYWLGDTNAPMPYVAYTGTNPPATITITGTAWVPTFGTTNDTVFLEPHPGAEIINPQRSYVYPTGVLFMGSSYTSVVESVATTNAASQYLWRTVSAIAAGTNTATVGDSVRLLWNVHHSPAFRLTADEFDRMYVALTNMTHTYSSHDWATADITQYEWVETNDTWRVATNWVNVVLGHNPPVAADNDWLYNAGTVTLPEIPAHLPAASTDVFVGYMDSNFSGAYWYRDGTNFIPGSPLTPWGTSVLPEQYQMHYWNTYPRSSTVTFDIGGNTVRDGTLFSTDTWRFVTEWDFAY